MQAQHKQEVEALKAAHAADTEDLQQFKKGHANPWKTRIELGLNGETGNTEKINFIGRIEANREVEADRLKIYAQSRFGRENGVRSVNEHLGGVNIERDISDRTFVFGKGYLENDEFEDLDIRARVTAGVGYFVIKKDKHEFKVRGGAGYQHETFGSGVSDDEGVAELGYDYMVDINDYVRITQAVTYFPSFDRLSEYRLVHEIAGEVPLNKEETWKLRIGMKNEFDDAPQPGVERLDTYYFMNFVFDLE